MTSLEVAYLSAMAEDERGGTAVVLLQGWGAEADDLVPLARALAREGRRMFVPAAPLDGESGGRAWWHLGPDTRPAWANDEEADPEHQPHALVTAAREAVASLIALIRQRYAPEVVALVGFSQGAMLALDAGLRADSGVDRIAAMSGALIADTQAGWGEPGPRLLLAHGRQDDVVPFGAGEWARELLEKRGHVVGWAPFDGGHEIPPGVVRAVDDFLA